ncbi:MAG: tetratricopeptide repeat protein [Desulfobaccales bacterium]
MAFFDFFKKRKQENGTDAIFLKIHNFQQGKELVNKAISYRELGLYDKAIEILKHVLKEFPQYLPAKTILGTTLKAKGDINGAEDQFKKIITEHKNDNTYPLIEIYANLGALYYFDKNDKNVALEYYDLALKQPKSEKIDFQHYKIMISNIHRDLSLLFFREGDLILAKKHALIRLESNKDCATASKIYGLCLVNEFTQDNKRMNYVTDFIENKNLIEAVDCLRNSLSENHEDYGCMAGIALALYYLGRMKYYNSNKEVADKIEKEFKLYFDKIKQDSIKSKDVKKYFDLLNDFIANFGIEMMQKVYGCQVSVKE